MFLNDDHDFARVRSHLLLRLFYSLLKRVPLFERSLILRVGVHEFLQEVKNIQIITKRIFLSFIIAT